MIWRVIIRRNPIAGVVVFVIDLLTAVGCTGQTFRIVIGQGVIGLVRPKSLVPSLDLSFRIVGIIMLREIG